MRKILKRFLTRDRAGRTLSNETERLTDTGNGVLNLTTSRTATYCPGCRRPVSDVNDHRGRCDYCRSRSLCVQCEVRCQACSRRLCGYCRRGFAGQAPVTVCPTCLVHLRRRQAFQDRLILQRAAYDRRMIRQRETARLQGLQLQAARFRTMAQLQASRLRIQAQMAMISEINRLRLALAKVRR